MFKKIVGFGDSWMYGDELTDPNNFITEPHARGLCNSAYRQRNCFLGQLGQHYNVPVENFGIMGGSLDSARWTFLYWLAHEANPEECLVLHAVTNSYRFSHYNPRHKTMLDDPEWNRFVHSTWALESKFQDLIKQQTVLTDSPELHQLRYQETTMLFDGVSARRDILMMQFNVFPELPLNLPTLFEDWTLKSWTTDTKPGGHPDETGHQKIAQHLINLIDRAIIVA